MTGQQWEVGCDQCNQNYKGEAAVRQSMKFVDNQFVCTSCVGGNNHIGDWVPEQQEEPPPRQERTRGWENRGRNVQASTTRPRIPGNGATEKQRRYAFVLVRQSNFDNLDEAYAEYPDHDSGIYEMTRREFSAFIEWLKE